jgi:hypothetical protein
MISSIVFAFDKRARSNPISGVPLMARITFSGIRTEPMRA